MKTIDDTSFDTNVLQANKPVLVDFSAEWCPPCKLLKPILQKFADAHPEIEVVYVDSDKSPQSSVRFGITAMPTLVLFDGGEVKGTTIGLQNEARLASFVTNALA